MSSVGTLSEESTLGDDHWYESACLYAVASGKIAAKKQHYADRAMEFLNESLKADFRDTDLLKTNTDLDSLRDREDFKRLLAELGKK